MLLWVTVILQLWVAVIIWLCVNTLVLNYCSCYELMLLLRVAVIMLLWVIALVMSYCYCYELMLLFSYHLFHHKSWCVRHFWVTGRQDNGSLWWPRSVFTTLSLTVNSITAICSQIFFTLSFICAIKLLCYFFLCSSTLWLPPSLCI